MIYSNYKAMVRRSQIVAKTPDSESLSKMNSRVYLEKILQQLNPNEFPVQDFRKKFVIGHFNMTHKQMIWLCSFSNKNNLIIDRNILIPIIKG